MRVCGKFSFSETTLRTGLEETTTNRQTTLESSDTTLPDVSLVGAGSENELRSATVPNTLSEISPSFLVSSTTQKIQLRHIQLYTAHYSYSDIH